MTSFSIGVSEFSGLPESPDLRGGNTAFTNTGIPFLSTSFLKASASLTDILYCEKAATNLCPMLLAMACGDGVPRRLRSSSGIRE